MARLVSLRLSTWFLVCLIWCSAALAVPVLPRALLEAFGSASQMHFGLRTGIPRGYFELCKQSKYVCRQSAGNLPVDGSGAVKLTEQLTRDLLGINATVNRSIRPLSDIPGRDRWSVEPASGDCEDYAITKKQALLRKGWPSASLLVSIVRTGGRQHAVLVVRTSSGDFVLDNLRNQIVGWNRTGYRFEKVQSPRETWVWYSL